jgi:DNA invertase Pin-like site-specific DNA recombinase
MAHVQSVTEVDAAVYARQSKDRLQGIKAQVADCSALCGLRGWNIRAVITDNDVSASKAKPRPGYTKLLGMIERGEIGAVVVSHVDRLLRKLTDLEHLIEMAEKHKVAVVTVSGDLDLSNDAGRTVGRILAVVARGEVERDVPQRFHVGHRGAVEAGRFRRVQFNFTVINAKSCQGRQDRQNPKSFQYA